MKTEDLVSLLSTGAEAVDLRLTSRRWVRALAGVRSSRAAEPNSSLNTRMKSTKTVLSNISLPLFSSLPR